jgi:hypothetical protein
LSVIPIIHKHFTLSVLLPWLLKRMVPLKPPPKHNREVKVNKRRVVNNDVDLKVLPYIKKTNTHTYINITPKVPKSIFINIYLLR